MLGARFGLRVRVYWDARRVNNRLFRCPGGRHTVRWGGGEMLGRDDGTLSSATPRPMLVGLAPRVGRSVWDQQTHDQPQRGGWQARTHQAKRGRRPIFKAPIARARPKYCPMAVPEEARTLPQRYWFCCHITMGGGDLHRLTPFRSCIPFLYGYRCSHWSDYVTMSPTVQTCDVDAEVPNEDER